MLIENSVALTPEIPEMKKSFKYFDTDKPETMSRVSPTNFRRRAEVKLTDTQVLETKVNKTEANGRIRSKGHVHGNWPTIIFIPIDINEEIVNKLKEQFKDVEKVDPLYPDAAFHLSLSRTLYLKEHQKDLFKKKISSALKEYSFLPKKLKCEKVEIYLNDEKTTTFIAIDVENDENILNLIAAIDGVLKDFGLPVYYKPAKLHFSLFRCSGDQKETLKLDELFNLNNLEVELSEILIKCGNKISRI